MDATDLWREDVFTDRKIGLIRRMTPVKVDGNADMGRKAIFVGEASLYTPAGTLPLSFEIEADTLEKAVGAYGDAFQEALQQALEELKEMRRKESSSLILPQGPGGLAGMPPGMPPGKLKL